MRKGGEYIREARRRAGLTQQELAERLGTTQSVIARWESGARSPTVDNLFRAVRACGLDLGIRIGPPDIGHEVLIRRNRGMTPGERLDHMAESVAGFQDLVSRARFVSDSERGGGAGTRAGSGRGTAEGKPRKSKKAKR